MCRSCMDCVAWPLQRETAVKLQPPISRVTLWLAMCFSIGLPETSFSGMALVEFRQGRRVMERAAIPVCPNLCNTRFNKFPKNTAFLFSLSLCLFLSFFLPVLVFPVQHPPDSAVFGKSRTGIHTLFLGTTGKQLHISASEPIFAAQEQSDEASHLKCGLLLLDTFVDIVYFPN